MIDKNSVYCGLYTIVDEFKTHLSASDLSVIQKESFSRSRSFLDIINKTCPYYGFTVSTLRTIAEYIEPAAFGFMCVVKSSNGVQKRYYSDNFKKLLQNAFGIHEHWVVSEISERSGIPKTSIKTLFNSSHRDFFESATPLYWAAFQDKLDIRIFICMRYGHTEVFGQGIQFSNPFAQGDVVLRFSKSHDISMSFDPFFTGENDSSNECLDKDKSESSQVISDADQISQETAIQETKADSGSDLVSKISNLNDIQFNQLLMFASSLYGFDLKTALIREAQRSNQEKAVSAFIDAISK